MRRLLTILALLPLSACEGPAPSEERAPVVRAPEAPALDAPQEAPARASAASREEEARAAQKAPSRAALPAVQEAPVARARPAEGVEREPRTVPALGAAPNDAKHAALLQSLRTRRSARADTAWAPPSAEAGAEEVVGAERKPADSFDDEMVLPGSVVM